jgi:hypothetical protein
MAVDECEGPWDELRRAVEERLTADGCAHLVVLGEEYVWALQASEKFRAVALEKPFTTLKSGRVLVHPGFKEADCAARRAVQLSRLLGLNKPRRGAGVDAFAGLDELGPRRKRRARKGVDGEGA